MITRARFDVLVKPGSALKGAYFMNTRAIGEKLFTSRGKKMYNESEVKKDVKQ